MEESRRFSWSELFIKGIFVIIFILFAVWLLSLSNKKLTNSLDVITDEIFAYNISKMKEVGKEYFTTERLPEKVGEIKTITLQELYNKKLLLELKDKFGKSCNPETSYIKVEKLENEYQMKINLECSKQEDYINVIMGCYNYCKTTLCEVKVEETTTKAPTNVKDNTPSPSKPKQLEYQYKKVVDGKWTEYGAWSSWSKIDVSQTDYRQVETKKVDEPYTYDKNVTEDVFVSYNLTCPSGYTLQNDKCIKNTTSTVVATATCPAKSGYTVSRNGFTCTYTKNGTVTATATCPAKSGYSVSQNGFSCVYTKSGTSTVSPTCPAKSGYVASRNGFSCTYTKSSTATINPTCPATYGNGTYSSISNFTCYYKYTTQQCTTVNSQKPAVSICPDGKICGSKQDTSYTTCTPVTNTTSTSASCPSGYTKSGSTCIKNVVSSLSATATCPSGYTQSGSSCTKQTTSTTTGTATCPSGYTQSGSSCTKPTTETLSGSATCPSGYTQSGSSCSKVVTGVDTKNASKACPTGTKEKADYTGCLKSVNKVVSVTENRPVTYYRYRVRQFINGNVDYKWSTSKEDKNLINSGYVLTGATR